MYSVKTKKGWVELSAVYQNKDTGEILTEEKMRKQWAEEHNGDNPTNVLQIEKQYRRIS